MKAITLIGRKEVDHKMCLPHVLITTIHFTLEITTESIVTFK